MFCGTSQRILLARAESQSFPDRTNPRQTQSLRIDFSVDIDHADRLPGMTDPRAHPQAARAVARIKASRVKDGQTEYLVICEGGQDSRGQWVASAKLDAPQALANFQHREQKKQARAKRAPAADPGGPRQLKEIRGLIPDGETWSFVVRFVDGTRDEAVPKATMRTNYPKQLLKFYESHIQQPAGEARVP
jgi:hypothetical protein